MKGTFRGVWNGGEFLGGRFFGPQWNNGTFKDGVFMAGNWNHGVFKNGVFGHRHFDSYWYRGDFLGGKFISTWEKGRFYNGTFEGKEFRGGEFRGGEFKKGKFSAKAGSTDYPVFRKGVFSGEEFGPFAKWEGGEWKAPSENWLGGTDKDGAYHSRGDSPDKWDKN